jgi:carboxyl-terminal processing protease
VGGVSFLRGDFLNKNEKYKNYGVCVLVSAAVGFGAAYFGFYTANREKIATGEKYALLDECRGVIAENGNPDFDDTAAMNGYLTTGGDKYTFYSNDDDTDPVEYMTAYVNSSGTASASGFQIGVNDDGNIIITDIDTNLAAYRQGIRLGDVITEIDGVSVADTGYENIANKLMGKQDTTVELKILRDGETIELTFTRDNEYQHTADGEKIGNIGYIKITGFYQLTQGNFYNAVQTVGDSDGYIIDLRNNGGGDGDVCMTLASYFIDEGYVTKEYFSGVNEMEKVQAGNVALTGKIVVLINGKTASAAEIMTALLKQYGEDVVLVGENTFGKGIFQLDATLSNGGNLHYTAGYYTVGEWECYNGTGISPDITVEMDDSLIGTDEDIQLQAALELFE